MSVRFVGNCKTVNWQELIESISRIDGDVRTYGVNFYQDSNQNFNEIIDLWKTAGYDKTETVEWINYYPGKHFGTHYVTQFEEYTDTLCARAWISKIRPGKYAPYHKDIDDNIEEYLARGDLVRYTAHPCIPKKGQILIIDETVLHLEEQGNVYKWSDYFAWHGGGNISFEPKYLFNYLGVKK